RGPRGPEVGSGASSESSSSPLNRRQIRKAITPTPDSSRMIPRMIMRVVKKVRPPVSSPSCTGGGVAAALAEADGSAEADGVGVADGLAPILTTVRLTVIDSPASASSTNWLPSYPSFIAFRPNVPGAMSPVNLYRPSLSVPTWWVLSAPSMRTTVAFGIGSPVSWSVTMPEISFTDGGLSGPRTRMRTLWTPPAPETLISAWPSSSSPGSGWTSGTIWNTTSQSFWLAGDSHWANARCTLQPPGWL